MQIVFMCERILEKNGSFSAVYFSIISIASHKLGSFQTPQMLFSMDFQISNYIRVSLKFSEVRIIEG